MSSQIKRIEFRNRYKVFSDVTEDDRETYHIFTLPRFGVRLYFLRELTVGQCTQMCCVALGLWVAWLVFAIMLNEFMGLQKAAWAGAVFIGPPTILLLLYCVFVIVRGNGQV